MKKIALTLIIIMMVFTTVAAQTMTQTTAIVDLSNITPQPEIGTVKLNINSFGNTYLKAIVTKDEIEYIYNIVSEIEIFPLQMESGIYSVSILGSNDGRRFRLLSEDTINVTLEKSIVFLSTHQVVAWTEESNAAVLAKELIKDALSD